MHVPSATRTASCRDARARPTSDPSCAQTDVLISRISVPPMPSGRKSTGAGGSTPAGAGGASSSTFGTSARRLASRKPMASGCTVPARHIAAKGWSTVSTVSASPSSKTRRRNTLVTASTPAAFCLLSCPSTFLSISSFSCVDLTPNVLPLSARSSSVPLPRSTTPVSQLCGGRSACVGMASSPAAGCGNLSATVCCICTFDGRAVVGSLLTSASCFILARPAALDSFPSCTRCLRVSTSIVFAPPPAGCAFGWALVKGSMK